MPAKTLTLHRLWNTLCKLCYSHFLSLSLLGNWRNWQLMEGIFFGSSFFTDVPCNLHSSVSHEINSAFAILSHLPGDNFQFLILSVSNWWSWHFNYRVIPFVYFGPVFFHHKMAASNPLSYDISICKALRFLIMGWMISHQHFLHLSSVPPSQNIL